MDIIQSMNMVVKMEVEKNSNTIHRAEWLKKALISSHFNFLLSFFH